MVTEASLSLNTDGIIIRFGNSLEGLLGYGADEARGRAFVDFLPEGKRGGFLSLLGRVRAEGLVTGQRAALLRKDGRVIEMYLSAYSLRDRSGEIDSFMVLLNTWQSVETPVILTDEFQRMFRFSNDAVAITDTAGHIIDVNRAFLETYGYAREEILGLNPRVLKSPHSTKALYERMWKDILDPDKGFWRGEIINLRKDRTEVPVLLSINAIKDRDGKIKNFLGIAFDMTEQKEMDRTRRMYVDYIVHDMRGPLTAIMTTSEILFMQLGEAVDEKVKKKLRSIFDSSVKLSNMAEDMLDYSRARGGGIRLNREACSFSSILKSAAAPFESSGKRLVLNREDFDSARIEDREITVDADKLQRVVYNLLSNGMKHASKEVRISYEFADSSLRFAVSNDGKPIPAREAERIFDPFYQTEDGVRTGGAGLGLSIVKDFIEAHGGRVWVERCGECGASFCFTVPV